MAIRVDKVIKQYNEVVELLDELVSHVEEDIPREQGTNTVDAVKELLCGPTRSYVDQD